LTVARLALIIVMMRSAVRLLAAALLFAPPALAVQQPDGTTVPVIYGSTTCSDRNVQICLDGSEGQQGAIAAIADADVIPDTFSPFCDLTFTVLARGSVNNDLFGWYNVVPDPSNPNNTLKPADQDLYAIVMESDGIGSSRTINIRQSPHYRGGEIGFFMAVGKNIDWDADGGGWIRGVSYVFYSQRQFNPDNVGTDSQIHLLIWQSVTHENSFYFGWEDLLGGGDNDFDDLLTRVDGIQCSGGGAACDTGDRGICAQGTMQCQKGELTCVPNQTARAEACNAFDDDCNGLTDDGAPCPEDKICDRGACVAPCNAGEFPCSGSTVCDRTTGYCVDPACATITCADGQTCRDGQCVNPCDGVVCPFDQVCRIGVCVDPCVSITCDEGFTCELGVCQSCSCTLCPSGTQCLNNLCIEDACATIECQAGFHCNAGDCVDNCAGALCPGGVSCAAGYCEGSPIPTNPDSDAGALDNDAGLILPGVGGSAGSGPASERKVGDDSICACRAVGGGTAPRALAAWAAFGALMALRSRSGRARRRRLER
jgi:hypothetical protein